MMTLATRPKTPPPYRETGAAIPLPVLLFLGLFENTKENLKNTKDLSHGANPQKPCKTSRKHSKRPREIPRKKNTKETKTPRKRRTGLSHNVSCGLGDYRCYTPTSFLENGLSQSKTGLTRGGYRRKSLPLKPIAL